MSTWVCARRQKVKTVKSSCGCRAAAAISYLVVEVVDLQLIAPSAVGKVETAVFFNGEQLGVLVLLKGIVVR